MTSRYVAQANEDRIDLINDVRELMTLADEDVLSDEQFRLAVRKTLVRYGYRVDPVEARSA